MRPYLLDEVGNAGSRTHVYGQRARDAVERARTQVLGARGDEILFTSGATESNNLAILGLLPHAEATGRRHVLTTAIEHKAVSEPMDRLRAAGSEVELLPVTTGGHVEPDARSAGDSARTRCWSRSCTPTTRPAFSSPCGRSRTC